jgi:hypothetical protein
MATALTLAAETLRDDVARTLPLYIHVVWRASSRLLCALNTISRLCVHAYPCISLIMSTLVSVVGNHNLVGWQSAKALPEDELAKFHAKFWGKEEPDIDITTGKHGDDDDMETEILDIDILNIEGKLLVRSEYIKLFKCAKKFYAENKTNFSLPPCLVITGQPGIGEFYLFSSFVYY